MKEHIKSNILKTLTATFLLVLFTATTALAADGMVIECYGDSRPAETMEFDNYTSDLGLVPLAAVPANHYKVMADKGIKHEPDPAGGEIHTFWGWTRLIYNSNAGTALNGTDVYHYTKVCAKDRTDVDYQLQSTKKWGRGKIENQITSKVAYTNVYVFYGTE